MRRGMIGMVALLLALSLPAVVRAADPVVVTQDRATLLKLPRDADNVIIGNPAYFAVTVEDPRLLILFGKNLGQTNMIVLDAQRETILSTSVVVLPDQEETSVHVWTPLRGAIGAAETVYTCSARNCVQTKVGLTGGAVPTGSAGAVGGGGGGGGGGLGAPAPEAPPSDGSSGTGGSEAGGRK